MLTYRAPQYYKYTLKELCFKVDTSLAHQSYSYKYTVTSISTVKCIITYNMWLRVIFRL